MGQERDQTRSPRSQAGFTFVELVVLLVLIGIVAAVAYSRSSTDALAVPTQAEKLAAVLRHTQALAMSQGTRHYVTLTTSNYNVFSTTAGVATPIAEQGSGQTGPFTLDGGVAISNITNLPGSPATLAFDGRGIPYTNTASPGTALATNAVVTLSKGTATRTIVIQAETGHVAVQ